MNKIVDRMENQPVPQRVTPSSGKRGQRFTAIITGRNLGDAGMQVFEYGNMRDQVVVTGYRLSSTKDDIEIEIEIRDQAPCEKYDLVLMDALGNEARLECAFKVNRS